MGQHVERKPRDGQNSGEAAAEEHTQVYTREKLTDHVVSKGLEQWGFTF